MAKTDVQNSKLPSPLKREVKSYAKTAMTFGIAGGETGQRIRNIMAILREKKATRRIETFSQAVARHGLSEVEIQTRTAWIKATATLITLISIITLFFLSASIYIGMPFSIVTLLCLGFVWSFCQALVWRFRYDQLCARELFSFKDWLLGRRTGEFK